MARYPAATWLGSPNENPHGMTSHRGLVLHIEQGTEPGTDAWFQNPASQVSAHFSISKTGVVAQFVDTDDKAWAEVSGNPAWLSCEFEGLTGQSLTDAQVNAAGRLYAWMAALYQMPFQQADDPTGVGIGWHGMGGSAWGGHIDCPGDPVKAQRGAILVRAQDPQSSAPNPLAVLPGGTTYVTPWTATNVVAALDCPTGGVWLLTATGNIYAVNCPISTVYGGMPAGNTFWSGRTAKELHPLAGGGYAVLDTAGETYAFPVAA